APIASPRESAVAMVRPGWPTNARTPWRKSWNMPDMTLQPHFRFSGVSLLLAACHARDERCYGQAPGRTLFQPLSRVYLSKDHGTAETVGVASGDRFRLVDRI